MNTTEQENGGVAVAPAVELTRSARTFRPGVDIVEDTQELRILADMPGVSAQLQTTRRDDAPD